jgi:hypothetical protein
MVAVAPNDRNTAGSPGVRGASKSEMLASTMATLALCQTVCSSYRRPQSDAWCDSSGGLNRFRSEFGGRRGNFSTNRRATEGRSSSGIAFGTARAFVLSHDPPAAKSNASRLQPPGGPDRLQKLIEKLQARF